MWRKVLVISIWSLIFNNGAKASYCDRLGQRNRHVPKQRYVSIQDKLRNVSIYWSTNDSRAASALLAIMLRYLVGYQGVYLHQSHEAVLKNDVILALSDPPSPEFVSNAEDDTQINCGNGIGLRQFYVHIAQKFRNLKQCVNATSWTFYHNFTSLKDCGFIPVRASDSLMTEKEKSIPLYTLNRENAKIIEKFNPIIVPIKNIIVKGCLDILHMLTASTHSFLFYDDDIWTGNPDVSKIQLPPGEGVASTCKDGENTFMNIRLINPSLILEYAPLIYQIGNIELTYEYLKVILEKEGIKGIEEAACEWALENILKVKKWTEQDFRLYENQYNILHFYDDKDHDSKLYNILPRLLAYQLTPVNFNSKTTFTFGLYHYPVNSKSNSYISDVIDNFMNDKNTCLTPTRQQLLGAVVGIEQNTFDLQKNVNNTNLPIILYNDVGVNTESKPLTWLATGNTFHLALALQNFVLDMNFTQIDVISEPTKTAKHFIKDLQEIGRLKIQDYTVNAEIFHSEAEGLVLKIKRDSARIIFVNTNYEKALTILTAAESLKINSYFVWIVREWRPSTTFNFTCIRLSFLYENLKYIKDNDGWLEFRQAMKNNLWRNFDWPVRAPALVDALVTLVKGFEATFRRHPHIRHDIHSDFAIREFERSIVGEKILGVTQNFIYDYKRRTLGDTVLILEEFNGMESKLLARYQVYVTARVVNIVNMAWDYFKYAKTLDGECFLFNGYIYQKTCYDVLIYGLAGTLLTIIILRLTFKVLSRPIYQQVNR